MGRQFFGAGKSTEAVYWVETGTSSIDADSQGRQNIGGLQFCGFLHCVYTWSS